MEFAETVLGASMPRRRTKVTDYIEVKHVYHPGTGQLLGVFAVDDIPADPKKLIAFVRRKAKAAKAPLERVEPQTEAADGWDYVRKLSCWFQVVDPGFWKQRQTALELLPFGVSSDLNGLHNPRRPGSAEDCDYQLWRDRLKEHALLATHKLTGLDTCSDPLNALLDILKSNPKYGGTTTLVSGASGEQRIEKHVRCIRTGLQALYSALATQALENEIRLVASPDGGVAGSQLAENRPGSGVRVHPQKWEDLEISILSDHRLELRVAGQAETLNYREMSLADRRSGKPNQSWGVLLALAQGGGVIPETVRNGKQWLALEKQIERTRKVLRECFALLDDPLPFEKGTGYRARFEIRCAASFEK
jgi:hypothetical protein